MLAILFPAAGPKIWTLATVVTAAVLTFVLLAALKNKLPRDGGREFAVNGAKSIGKPRGAGLLLIVSFVITTLLFIPSTPEFLIYLVLTIAEMLSGYFDDASDKPWGRLIKGILDLVVALTCAITWLACNPNTFTIALTGTVITVPRPLYAFLIVVLIWASINVVNCSDGVDGLCASLSIMTLFPVLLIFERIGAHESDSLLTLCLIIILIVYLWFNSSPSLLLMGDAGSRAIGFLIALIFLKSGYPLLFIPLALIMILDGGLGLLKITLIKVTHHNPFKKLRTPLHDHTRKEKGWSDTQTVVRFTVLQALIGLLTLYALF